MSLKLGITYDNAGECAGFYLPEEDRATHVYVLGSSGVGKSKGLANWILGDILNDNRCDSSSRHSRDNFISLICQHENNKIPLPFYEF